MTFVAVMNILLGILLISAVITDLKSAKIPNMLLVISFIAGVSVILVYGNTAELPGRLLSLFCGIAVLFIPFVLGGIGAGDVKFLGIIGFFSGIQHLINITLISFVIGGILALSLVFYDRLKRLRSISAVFASFQNFLFTKKLLLQEEGKITIPFSIPLAIGTVLVMFFNAGVML